MLQPLLKLNISQRIQLWPSSIAHRSHLERFILFLRDQFMRVAGFRGSSAYRQTDLEDTWMKHGQM
jgi:hypothetical protein